MEFNDWLLAKLKDFDWSQATLAKRSGLTRGAISNYINGRIPDDAALNKIARAFRTAPDVVFRAAGMLPSKSDDDADVERAEHLVRSFKTDQYRQIALATLETLLEQEERAAVNAVPRPADQAP